MRPINADDIVYEPMLSAKGNGMYEDVMVAYKNQIDAIPTIEQVTVNLDEEQVASVIEHRKKVQEQRWIPCSERLPEDDGDYLVCYEEGYREDYGFDEIGIVPFEVDCEGFGIWQEYFDHRTLGSLGSDWVDIPVIAWMPLPEPWKGDKE
ncbi:MAG: DUF551 domain-containing protein [Lachnospiraceae bacterium]|nr:DUF551 domain-containing protein [Lachnospiraceae bacterium]